MPLALALLTVRAAVPVDFKVSACRTGVLSATLPNARLLVLQLIVATEGTSCRVTFFVTPPELAVRVTDFEDVTAANVAVKVALAALAATVTFDGTVTEELVLPSVTLTPPLGAGPFNVTLHVSVPEPVTDELTQESPLNIPD